jgi:serine protease AprX
VIYNKKVYCMFLLFVMFILPVSITGMDQDTIEEIIPTEIKNKIGNGLLEEISNGSKHVFDVIVGCDKERKSTYIEDIRYSVSNVEIDKEWNMFSMFKAQLTLTQIKEIAQLSYVNRLDNNSPVEACMSGARGYTSVDYLRTNYPYSFDGDDDGNRFSYSKDDIVIAILDTGIDTDHYDLDGGKVIGWKDFIGDEDEPYDDKGHGTHCASIAAGSGDASWTYRGVAPYAALVGVKMLNSGGGGTKEIAIDALEWVGDNADTYGIEIVSCSWGWDDYGDYDNLAIALDTLIIDNDIIGCVAAGNDGPSSNTIRTPGTAKYAITVGNAIDPSEGGWELNTNTYPYQEASSHGPCDDQRIKPDILAPGTDIRAAKAGTTNQYIEYTGTSMATPFVAGLAALFLDYDYSLRYDHGSYHPYFKYLLMASAVDMPDDSNPGVDNAFGAGRVDAWQTKEYFLDYDISSGFSNAPLVLEYSSGYNDYERENEPLWMGDENYRDDYYKIQCYATYMILIYADGDPDLTLRIRLYDQYQNQIKYSAYGNDMYLSHQATYSGVYYIKIQAYLKTGDYYDIEIWTYPS